MSDWRTEVVSQTNSPNYGLEVYAGIKFYIGIDITKPPREVEESYQGNTSTKYEFDIEMKFWKVIEDQKAHLDLLKQENEKKYNRICTQPMNQSTTMKLTRTQCNLFAKFLLEFEDDIVWFEMWRTGTGVKTKYHFEKWEAKYKSEEE